jgi:hypothetical protein
VYFVEFSNTRAQKSVSTFCRFFFAAVAEKNLEATKKLSPLNAAEATEFFFSTSDSLAFKVLDGTEFNKPLV